MEKIKNLVKTNKIAMIGIVVVIIVFILGGYFLKSEKKATLENLESIYNPKNPIVIKENSKYGYITSEGKVMIEPKYKSASEFNGKFAVVAAENTDKEDYHSTVYQVINQKGEVLASAFYSSDIEYVSEYNVWVIDGVLYDHNMKAITQKNIEVEYVDYGFLEYQEESGKSGIMDVKGKVIFSWDLENCSAEISEVDETITEYYARIKDYDDQRLAILNLQNGKIVYEAKDPKNIYLDVEDDNIFYVKKSSSYNFISALYLKDGKIVYQNSEEEVELSYVSPNVIRIEYEEYESYKDKYKYYDLKSGKLLDSKPSEEKEDLDSVEKMMDIKKFSCDDGYGIMDGDTVLVSCEYDRIEFLPFTLNEYMSNKYKQNIILARKDDKTYAMDYRTKKQLFDFDSKYVSASYNSTFITAQNSDSETIVYNLLSKKSMTFGQDARISKYSNYIIVTTDNEKVYYNTNLKKIYTTAK